MHVTIDQFSDKFNNGGKKIKMADLLRLFAFYGNNLTLGCDNLKSFSCILRKFVMHVSNKQFSDKFNNGWEKLKSTWSNRFIVIFGILRQYFEVQ